MNNFSFIPSDEFHKTLHRIYRGCNLFRDDDWKSLFNERSKIYESMRHPPKFPEKIP